MASPWRGGSRSNPAMFWPAPSSSSSSSSRPSFHFHRAAKGSRVSDDYRYWVFSPANPPLPSKDRFVVLSFNILSADKAALHRKELYPHIPPYILSWGHRKARILLEIVLWSPDVICFQEVDRFAELQEELGQRGYLGVFKGCTGAGSDGCAMFWRERKFTLVEEQSIEFKEWDLRNNVAQLCVLQLKYREQSRKQRQEAGSSNQPNNIQSGSCIIFCNIHVLYNPKRGDIKIGQVRVLLERTHALSKKWGGIPAVIAGDFNSTPQSPLYRFICTSRLDVSLYDRRSISGQLERSRSLDYLMHIVKLERNANLGIGFDSNQENTNHFLRNMQMRRLYGSEELRSTTFLDLQYGARFSHGDTNIGIHLEHHESQASDSVSSDVVSLRKYSWNPEELKAATGDSYSSTAVHLFKLRSAYASIRGPAENRDMLGEPLVTTYHKQFMGTVDYIWYTEGLCPIRLLDILPVNVLERTGGLPSQKWGSDHLALACEFVLLTSKEAGPAGQFRVES